jgi:hypothetical protein
MAATVGTQYFDLPGPVLLSQDIQTRREGFCHLVAASRFSHQVRYLPLSVFRIRIGLSADTVPDPAITGTLPRIQIRIRIQLYHNGRGKTYHSPLDVHFPDKMIPAGSHVHTWWSHGIV